MLWPLAVAGILLSLATNSDPQNARPNQFSAPLPEPDVSESLQLANYLFQRPLGPQGLRKDCRMLNVTEWARYLTAVNRAKADTRVNPNVYDAFAFLHSHPRVNLVAHGSPVFLSYHRVLLYLYEKLLRIYDPEVSLCYWDTTMEASDPALSASWTTTMFGTRMGQVVEGLGADWNTPVGVLTRQVGARGRALNMDDVTSLMGQRLLQDISFPNGHASANMEELHNHVHSYVGGQMTAIETAAYDPLFWPHHTWVDCTWEYFRDQQRSRGIDPQYDWPVEYGDQDHGPFHSMRLGRTLNLDGQNDFFSRRVLRCEPPPSRCQNENDCGRLMVCDSRTRRCTAQTRPAFETGPMGGMFSSFQNFMGNFNNMFGLGGLPGQGAQGGGQFGQMPGGGFPGFG